MSGKSLKNYTFYLHQTKLVRRFSQKYLLLILKTPRVLKTTFLPQLDRKGRSKPCEGANRSCEACESVKDTTKLKKAESEETFDILKGPLDYNFKSVIYLYEYKICQFKFPYAHTTVTKFRFRFNNYKSTHCKFRNKMKKEIIQKIKKVN